MLPNLLQNEFLSFKFLSDLIFLHELFGATPVVQFGCFFDHNV